MKINQPLQQECTKSTMTSICTQVDLSQGVVLLYSYC